MRQPRPRQPNHLSLCKHLILSFKGYDSGLSSKSQSMKTSSTEEEPTVYLVENDQFISTDVSHPQRSCCSDKRYMSWYNQKHVNEEDIEDQFQVDGPKVKRPTSLHGLQNTNGCPDQNYLNFHFNNGYQYPQVSSNKR